MRPEWRVKPSCLCSYSSSRSSLAALFSVLTFFDKSIWIIATAVSLPSTAERAAQDPVFQTNVLHADDLIRALSGATWTALTSCKKCHNMTFPRSFIITCFLFYCHCCETGCNHRLALRHVLINAEDIIIENHINMTRNPANLWDLQIYNNLQ